VAVLKENEFLNRLPENTRERVTVMTLGQISWDSERGGKNLNSSEGEFKKIIARVAQSGKEKRGNCEKGVKPERRRQKVKKLLRK